MIKEVPDFKRGNFFTGLMATPDFWNDIQNYHFNKETFYNLVFHGEGIIPGVLEEFKVSPVKKGGNLTVVVSPGVAIDKKGKSLFLKESKAVIIDYKKFNLPETIYIVLRYDEQLDEYYQSKENPEFQGYKKLIETAKIEITAKQSPDDSALEIGRIYLEEDDNGEIKKIGEPQDMVNPKSNEIDTRFVLWTKAATRGTSPYLRNYLASILEETKKTAAIANDAINLPGFRELQTVTLTAKMLVQCGNVAFDDIINILYPLYDINNHIIQEMLDYERDKGKRIFSSKEYFESYRVNTYDMGELIKYYDNKLESIDKILKLQEKILENLKNIIVSKKVTLDDVSLISYDLPRILVIDDERYTLVEFLDFNDFETEENHAFNAKGAKECTSSKQSFTYPDGEKVRDTVKRFYGGEIKFSINNLVKKRELIMIRRTDIFHGNYTVDVGLNDEYRAQLVVDGYDTKNRWRNLFMVFDEELITNSKVTMSFTMDDAGRDCFGKIWFYQRI